MKSVQLKSGKAFLLLSIEKKKKKKVKFTASNGTPNMDSVRSGFLILEKGFILHV